MKIKLLILSSFFLLCSLIKSGDKRLIYLHKLPDSKFGIIVKGEGKFPRLAKFEDGTLFVATHRGTHRVTAGNSLQGFVSDDGGYNWYNSGTMFSKHDIDPRSPAVGVGPDGVLYSACRERSLNDPFNSRVAFYRSSDRGLNWTFVSEVNIPDEKRVGHPYGKLMFLNDYILLPVYTITKDRDMDSRLFVSMDGGLTWAQRSIISDNANETSLLGCPDRNILALYRTNDNPSLVCSRITKDNGYTWSSALPVTKAREIPAEAIFLNEQTLICFYGCRHKPYGVRGIVSHNSGRSWRNDIELVVDTFPPTDCGYPTVEKVDDDKLLIVWYINNDNPIDIKKERQCRYLLVNINEIFQRL